MKTPYFLFLLLIPSFFLNSGSVFAQAGAAINFDGSSDRILPPSAIASMGLSGNPQYTIEAWIKPTSSNRLGIAGWGSYSSNSTVAFRTTDGFEGAGGLVIYWWGADLTVPANGFNLLDGNWHHVATTYNGSQRVIYVDGIQRGSDSPGTGGRNVSASNFWIGMTNPGSPEYFRGSMDELRIWNKALTQAEIQTYMNCQINETCPNLKLYYQFNQGTAGANNGSVTSALDASGNNLNGTLVSFALNGPVSNWIAPGAISSTNNCSTVTCSSIQTGTITGSPLCAGASVSVPYTVSSSFNGGNLFTAQLSNSSGSFASPVNIGSLSSSTSGTISATIPGGTASGSNYRIRVIGTSPAVNGTSNGVFLSITTSSTWYLDADNDGHYISSISQCSSPGIGYNQTATQNGDCDDSDNSKWQSSSLYVDADGDGYTVGSASTICYGASIPLGYSATSLGTDCNDGNSNIHPGATDICGNSIDEDCSGSDLSCAGLWVGGTSTDWNTATNWNPSAVPLSGTDVIIPDVTNDPVISGSITVNNVDLASGATLTVASGGTLTLNGALANAGAVTIQSGGSFLQGGSSSITGAGTFSIQRQGSASYYNMWSSPITAQNGVPGTSYAYSSSASTQDDSDDANDPGWSAFNGVMTPGRGYAGQGGNLATFTGTPNNGNVNYGLYYTAFDNTYTQTSGGTPFNLVGNPYPSAISAASFLAANNDLFGTIYLWNDNGSNNYSRTDYAYWNGTGGLGTGGGPTPNGFIGSCQGFMVRALSGGAVANFTNSQRVTGNNTQFHRENGADSRLWLSVENENVYNEILIGLLEDATNDEDVMYDAVKLKGNPDISLSTVDAGTEYAIMAFPPPLTEKTVPLQLEISQAGTYTFMANTMENFEGHQVRFVDLQTGMDIPLHEGEGIEVPLQAGQYVNRFYLNFSPMSATGIEDAAEEGLNAWMNDDRLFIRLNSEVQDATLQVIDMNGKVVAETSLSGSNTGMVSVPFRAASGVYMVRVSNQNISLTKKILR